MVLWTILYGCMQVRWADIEEQKQQAKMRAIGFVVGQTNWNRMMDPTYGESALTQTKYIDKIKRNQIYLYINFNLFSF